jgi:hypothetical protein
MVSTLAHDTGGVTNGVTATEGHTKYSHRLNTD